MGYSSRFASGVAFLAFVLAAPAAVLAQGAAAIEGFGGLSLSAPQSQSPSLGGTVTFSVVPGVQIVGEAGRIGKPLVPGGPEGLLKSGSLFLGVDSPIGPLYLGVGRAADGNSSAYLFLGRP